MPYTVYEHIRWYGFRGLVAKRGVVERTMGQPRMAAFRTTMSMFCSCSSTIAANARMLAMLDKSHCMTTSSPVPSGMRCLLDKCEKISNGTMLA